MARLFQAPFLFYGQPLYKVKAHQGVHMLEPLEIYWVNPKYKQGVALPLIVGMELHHKPWLEVYQKARLSEWMVSNKLLTNYCASSKLLKLSPMIRKCNENK
jgi:hypothetical protein